MYMSVAIEFLFWWNIALTIGIIFFDYREKKMIELDWPYCGERRIEVRKNPRNEFEQKLAESMRGGRETIYSHGKTKQETRKVDVYQWEGHAI